MTDGEYRIKKFLTNYNEKILFLLNVINDGDKIAYFLHELLQNNPRQHLIVLFNTEIPLCFLSTILNVKLAQDYLSKDDCEEIDRYVFEGLSTGWYSYRGITDYRNIPLGKLFEYDFQKYLVPRIKSLEVIRNVIEKEDIQKIICIEDSGELMDVAKLCGKALDKPVLVIPFKRNRKTLFKFSSIIMSKLSYFLSNLLDSLAYRRLRKLKANTGLVLIDAKLPKYFMPEEDEIALLLCPLEGGINIRLNIIKRGSSYLPLYFKGQKIHWRDWVTYKEKWKDLTSDENFKAIFKYEGISLWEMVCDRLSTFFLKDIPRMISNINLLDEALKANNIKIVVLRNDVKEFERTIVFCCRSAKASSFVIQHGILAETNGHNILLVDKFAAWGKASIDWYLRSGNPLDKFEITGNPRFDRLINWRPKISKPALCRQLNLDIDKGIILFATQQINKFSSFWTDDLFWVLADKLLKAIEQFPDKQLIIKVDPYEDLGPYRKRVMANSHNNAVAIRDIDIYSLIFFSELVITQDSTVGLEAMVFDKPIITMNLTKRKDRVPYAEKKAALGVYEAADLPFAIEKILTDEETKLQLKDGRSKFIKDYAYNIDGKANERILALIKNYLEN